MPKHIFHFKQFSIYQPYKDVMRVGTDSVLLGSFINVTHTTSALDIGCGTGILCLMMAQKNPQLKIIGIDINSHAIECTEYNIKNSHFANQINTLNISLQNFLLKYQNTFDIIVSNPPYFSNALQSSQTSKNTYRHQITLSIKDIIHAASMRLNPNGSLNIIVPFSEQTNFQKNLDTYQLFIHRKLSVFSKNTHTHPYIMIYEIKKMPPSTPYQEETITLYNEYNKNTDEHLNYTKDFYLFAK